MSNINFSKIKRILPLAITFILVALISGIIGGVVGSQRSEDNYSGKNLSEQKKIVTTESKLINQIVKNVGPSVVSLKIQITDNSQVDFFGRPLQQSGQAAGTGIILTSDGLIVTNRHVVPDGATNVSVTLSDGKVFKDVSIVGKTNENDSLDIAFLKINNLEEQKLVPASLGNSANVRVGDSVVAIGNALGQFQNTVTSGIISGYGRSIEAGESSGQGSTESLINLFQTDTAINEGNSGGPLVNMNAQVIGINTAVAGNAQNIGFAIPINDVTGLINSVIKTGKLSRPYLGVRYVPLTQELADQYNLKVSNGAYIAPSGDEFSSSVLSDGPAGKAGVQEKDIIIAVNDKKIDQSNGLASLLGMYQPGDKVKLTILRGDKTIQLNVTLGSLPAN